MNFDPNNNFPPKTFDSNTTSGDSSSTNNPTLIGEKQIVLYYKNVEKNIQPYKVFNDLFSTYLSKLPNNNVRQYVTNLYSKDLVFLGSSPSANDGIFSRVLLTSSKLAGIVLDSSDLDIDVSTGETDRIDDCIYSVYFGLIRSAVLLNESSVRQNKKLHKYLSTYVFLIMLKTLGKNNIYSEKQKQFIYAVSIYAYYKFFLNENHNYVLSTIKNEYSDLFQDGDASYLDEFLNSMKNIKKYDSMKDIVKILIDLNLIKENPNVVLINLLKTLQSSGFYSFIGSLDYLIALACTCHYPTGLFPKTSLTSEKLHKSIEDEIVKLINKIQYDLTIVPKNP